jgi:UTP--glucose-1-phosphate uridylyltransferase
MLETLPPEIAATLREFHFERIPFDALRARVAGASDLEELHRIRAPIAPGSPNAVHSMPAARSAEWNALALDGAAAIARGELAAVVLAGGMATRFGSTVKALATLFDDRPIRFIDAKLADIAHGGGGHVDTTFMTSFATDAAIAKALEGTAAHRARQFASLRLTSTGELFHDSNGQVSLHATGHGDLPEALAISSTIARLRAKGARTILMSNVDNLGATLDPAVFAMHRRLGAPITVELVSKLAGDKGGIPVALDGRLVLAEAFRLPKGFPQDDFPMFNTNTLWIDLDALEGEFPWTWCIAKKRVDGLEAIQLERLIGELTWWKPTQYLRVPRDGVASRFLPVKDLDELERSGPAIEKVLRERMGMTF